MKEDRKKRKAGYAEKALTITAILMTAIGVALLILFLISDNALSNREGVILDRFGAMTSGIVGSIFTLVGFVLLFLTLKSQQNQFNSQQERSSVQQFESQLFELIRYHRDNVSEMEHYHYFGEIKSIVRGRDVFVLLMRELLKIYDCVCTHLLQDTATGKEGQRLAVKISYTIFYFGLSEEATDMTNNRIGYIIEDYVRKENDHSSSSKLNTILNDISGKKRNDPGYLFTDTVKQHCTGSSYWGGHQSKLGFYFRHIYRTLCYIDKQDILSDEQKMEYADILRAQISTYEQNLFFIDSIVDFNRIRGNGQMNNNKTLFEKYGIIRNLSNDLLRNINPRNYYDLEYEYSFPNPEEQ